MTHASAAGEECVFDTPDCGEVVLWDASGEPWCAGCRDLARAEALRCGLNDPEQYLN